MGAAMRAAFRDIPEDATVAVLDEKMEDTGYGVLRNNGPGAALPCSRPRLSRRCSGWPKPSSS